MIIILKNIKQLVLIFIFLNSANVLNAQPLKKDYVRTAIELGLFISIEYDFFNLNSYQNKRIEAPNKFDNYFLLEQQDFVQPLCPGIMPAKELSFLFFLLKILADFLLSLLLHEASFFLSTCL